MFRGLNYFANELIDVSSYKTTLAQANVEHTLLRKWGSLTTTYSIYRGTDWLGARDDDGGEIDYHSDAKLQFLKHSLSLSLNYIFNDRSYTFGSNLYFQYTDDYLYSNDKLSVGSSYSVRGYIANLLGNKGLYIQNNLNRDIQIKNTTITPFLGLDYGKIRCEKDNEDSCGEIYSTSGGFKLKHKSFSSSFSWSRPIKDIDSNYKQEDIFRYDISYKF